MFNANVNNSKQRVGSESPHLQNSSLIFKEAKSPLSQTPKLKFIPGAKGNSNIFTEPRKAPENESNL